MKACVGTLALALCAAPAVGAAQQNPVADAFRAMEQRHAKNITDAAEEMPADKYGFKPTPAQMSFGDVSGQKAPTRPKLTGADPKDKLVAGLKESFQFCSTALGSIHDDQLGDSVPFFGGRKVTRGVAVLVTVADWADHYSQLAIYLRLNGHLPPTARRGM